MIRLTLDFDEQQLLLDTLTRAHRATLAPELAELHRTIANAPRIVAFVVSVPLPTVLERATQKSGGEETPAAGRHVNASASVGAGSEGAEPPPPVGRAAGL